MRRWRALFLGAAVLAGGCGAPPRDIDRQPAATTLTLPSYSVVRNAHNRRVRLLDRFWTRTVVRVDYKDEEGRPRSEQVEGHIQFVAPRDFLMSFDKLGKLYYLIGSNDDRYWWIQLGEGKHAVVGSHELAGRTLARRVELKVHPLDLISLLAIRPLPDESLSPPAWSQDGKSIEVELPARSGSVRMRFDPRTLEPSSVELRAEDGTVVATSQLTRYIYVTVERDQEGATPRVSQRFWVTAADGDLSIKVDLYEPQTSDQRPRARDFDLDRLLRIYHVDEIDDLDAQDQAIAPGET